MPTQIPAYLHSMSPFAVEFGQGIGIRWYGLAYLTGFIVTYYIIRFMSGRGKSQVPVELVSDLIFAGAMGTIIGGRLGYCLFYSPDLLFDFRRSFPFWGVLAVNEGGMASHGGMIGIAAACCIFARKHKLSALHLMDLMTLGGAIGIFFGRLANFVNGELVGRIVTHPILFAVKYPSDILNWPSSEPTRLTSLAPAAAAIGVPAASWSDLCAKGLSDPGAWPALHNALQRIVFAAQHRLNGAAEALAPLLDARYPSQIYEAVLEGLLILVVLLLFWKRPRKPGMVVGLFFTVYAAVRIVGEQFRMPDAQIGFQLFGLTRGQWLSFGLLAAGLSVLFAAARLKNEKLGGWGSNFSLATNKGKEL